MDHARRSQLTTETSACAVCSAFDDLARLADLAHPVTAERCDRVVSAVFRPRRGRPRSPWSAGRDRRRPPGGRCGAGGSAAGRSAGRGRTRSPPRYPDLYVGDPAAIGATRINFRSTDAGYRDLLHRTFYGDVGDERFLAFANGLVPDNPTRIAAAEVGATAKWWGSIPRSYVLTTQDRVVAPALQRRMIDDADRFAPAHRFRVGSLESSH
jgi:hypothetical protein